MKNSISSPNASLKKESTQKDKEKTKAHWKKVSHSSYVQNDAEKNCFRHHMQATSAHMRGACGFRKWQHFVVFSHSGFGKTLVFQPKPICKYVYKYKTSCSQISIQKKAVQEEGRHYEYQMRSLSSTPVLRICQSREATSSSSYTGIGLFMWLDN